MASQFAAKVTAQQVGSYFVQQYYQVFQQQRDYVHQFYNESSSLMRVDGEITHSASDMMKIHELLMSQNFTGIEIKTINSLESWSGGVLVAVSGSVKSRDFNGWRKFFQTFFLAPQDKGYYVMNDVFHYGDEEVVQQTSAPIATMEQNIDYQPAIPGHHTNPPVSDYPLEEAAGDYISSLHIEGDGPVQEYGYPEHHQQDSEPESEPELEPEPAFEPEPEPEPEIDQLEQEPTFEESRALLQSTVSNVQDPPLPLEEPVGEPKKLTYASILRAKGNSTPTMSSQPDIPQNRPPVADWNHVPQPVLQQSTPNLPYSSVDTVEDLSLHEGEPKSVYVRNLPSTVTTYEIQEEFKKFGKIQYDGVFLRNRAETGVCYAFVEFEDLQSVWNAIKASPIQMAGRNVYIEERRPNAGPSRGGRSGGRGRGGRGGRASGRGIDQNGSDSRRVRNNGFRGT
ncbi:nuclear transport factor 2 isoform X2 [Andrographis paniculata]|uniref:nuclear transport factor 2 isoform X2 n=1 Tax=Andrographis paniculata TaxID=175694 RepID=UPI0021E7DF90|nr:nuclear transport factor 2 isoform X2 [Andrographis paniculata]